MSSPSYTVMLAVELRNTAAKVERELPRSAWLVEDLRAKAALLMELSRAEQQS